MNNKISRASYKLLKNESFDLIHHLRPFLFESTFHSTLLLPQFRHIPFILGPFCLGYTQPDMVETSSLDLMALTMKTATPFLSAMSMKTLCRANLIVVYDQATEQTISRYISKEKIKIIPPGVSCPKFRAPVRLFDQKPIRLISVGYLLPRKKFDLLLKAFRAVIQHIPDVHLTIVGNGPEERTLKLMIASLGLEQKVTMTGFVQNRYIADLYRQSDIYVSLPQQESFGQVFLEAMASGLPIVTSNTIGASSIINHDSFGLLVDPGDWRALAEKLITLLKQPNKLRHMSQSVSDHVSTTYDWPIIFPQYEELYDSILRKKNG